MGRSLKFLKVSSAVVKVAAWIFLLLGLVAGVFIMLGAVGQEIPRKAGPVVFLIYALVFFLLNLIAGVADLAIKIYEQTKKE